MFDPKTIDPLDLQTGDYVRSHDFPMPHTGKPDPDRPACYVEGWIRGFEVREGVARYMIQSVARVFDGKPVPLQAHEDTIYPPENGTGTMFGGKCLGVELLRRPINELYQCDGQALERLKLLNRSMYECQKPSLDLMRDMAKTLEHLLSQLTRTE